MIGGRGHASFWPHSDLTWNSISLHFHAVMHHHMDLGTWFGTYSNITYKQQISQSSTQPEQMDADVDAQVQVTIFTDIRGWIKWKLVVQLSGESLSPLSTKDWFGVLQKNFTFTGAPNLPPPVGWCARRQRWRRAPSDRPHDKFVVFEHWPFGFSQDTYDEPTRYILHSFAMMMQALKDELLLN